MTATFILYIVISFGTPDKAGIVITSEHSSKRTCDDARETIRDKYQNGYGGSIALSVCMPK